MREVPDPEFLTMYPHLLATMNVAKETKLATVLHIDNTKRRGKIPLDTETDKAKVVLDPEKVPGLKNFNVNAFFADAIYTEANAIEVGKRFGLPDFEGVKAWMTKHYPAISEYSAMSA